MGKLANEDKPQVVTAWDKSPLEEETGFLVINRGSALALNRL